MTPNKSRKGLQSEGMTPLAKARLTFAALILVTLFCIAVIWPNLPDAIPGSSFFNRFTPHLGLDLQGGAHLIYETDMSNIPAAERTAALEGSRDVIERRVNAFGVGEPVVQTTRQDNHQRIIVELPGVTNIDDAIRQIGETPLLEFKEIGPAPTSTKPLITEDLTEIAVHNIEQEALAQTVLDRLLQGEDFEALANEFTQDPGNLSNGGDLGWATRGKFTPLFEQVIFDELLIGELRNEPLQTEFGYHIIKKIDERKTMADEDEVRAAHILFLTESADTAEEINWINTGLSGKNLKRAQVVFHPQSNEPQVSLDFDAEGKDLFADITTRNLNQPVGIFLDGQVISAPTVQSTITGGQAVITGGFTLEEAKLLSQRLNAGALPVPVTLISQQTVGATLGQESLAKSFTAGLLGLGLVALFMVIYYLLPGLLSVLSLGIYAVIVLMFFEIIPITLTLAGIAGFVLSIGMAVDANILIFERLKEELALGESLPSAVEAGFKRAWPSIRDSNVSSLITCVILYWFGTSIIRGFALTLGVGILVSMFSAITVTRTLLRLIAQSKLSTKRRLFSLRSKNV